MPRIDSTCRAICDLRKLSAIGFRDAEYVLAMRDREEDVVLQMAAELNNLFVMT